MEYFKGTKAITRGMDLIAPIASTKYQDSRACFRQYRSVVICLYFGVQRYDHSQKKVMPTMYYYYYFYIKGFKLQLFQKTVSALTKTAYASVTMVM